MNNKSKIFLAFAITLFLVASSLAVPNDAVVQANTCGVAGTYPGYSLVAEAFVPGYYISGTCVYGDCYPPIVSFSGLTSGDYLIEARGTYGTGGTYESDAEYVRVNTSSPWSDFVPGYETDPLGEGLDELWVDDTKVEWSDGVFQVDHIYTLPWTVSGDTLFFQLKDWYSQNNSGGLCVALFIESTIPVDIDIKPGSDPSCFNSNEHGVIPVAIFGSADFDVTQIDVATVSLDGAAVAVKGKADKALAAYEDVNGDGFTDLVVKIVDLGGYEPGDGYATITGSLNDGTLIEGTGDICITQ